MTVFHPKKPEKEVISMRIPKDVLEILDQKSAQANISRNEFINQCILFALPTWKTKHKNHSKKAQTLRSGQFF